MTKDRIIGTLIGAAVIAVLWLTMGRQGPGQSTDRDVLHFVGVTVDYEVRHSADSVAKYNMLFVSEIEFHPGFVVIQGSRGSGSVVSTENLLYLGWH